MLKALLSKNQTQIDGEMAEWSNAPVLKTGKDASPSRVRIPVSPPLPERPEFPIL